MRVELDGVNKYYNRGAENEVYALKDVSLSIRDGEVVCLQGPSGSGKTTLLSIIGCLFPPTSGNASISGKQLTRLPDHFLTLHRRDNVGFIFQRYNLIEPLSVLDNVTIPLLPLGIPPRERNRRARELLKDLGILHRERFPANKISGGEMQRVAIARALICNPPLVLADEPTAHLDNSLSLQFMDTITALKNEGRTIIITSHDPLIAEHQAIDALYTINDGVITDEKVF